VKLIFVATLLLALSGCALPQTTVRAGSTQPSLAVKGAPAGAVLFVDGLAMGAAQQFDGNPKVLAVLEGAHQVEIRQGTSVVYSEKVYVTAGETHAIAVLPGAAP
jgi:hypothetical protein